MADNKILPPAPDKNNKEFFDWLESQYGWWTGNQIRYGMTQDKPNTLLMRTSIDKSNEYYRYWNQYIRGKAVGGSNSTWRTYEELVSSNLPARTKLSQIKTYFPDRYNDYIINYGTAEERGIYEQELLDTASKAADDALFGLGGGKESIENIQGYQYKVITDADGNKTYEPVGIDPQAQAATQEARDKAERAHEMAKNADNQWQAAQFEKMAAQFDKEAAQLQFQQTYELQQLQNRFQAAQSERAQGLQERQFGLQEQQFGYQKEMDAKVMAEQKAQRLAQLGANPQTWLQYGAESGQTPKIQPWMLPLMPQQQGFQAGQDIPGFTPNNMQNMPALLNPSAQYEARLSPTAISQMIGYTKARTGASEEDQQFQKWSYAPPTGQNRGLSRGT